MKPRLKTLIISILTLWALMSFSQKAAVVRMEVPAALESGAFHLETLGKDGAIIFYESNEINEASQRKWYFGLFNTQLDQIWLKFIL